MRASIRSAGPFTARPPTRGLTATAGARRASRALRIPSTARIGQTLTYGFDGAITIASAFASASTTPGAGAAASAPSKRTPSTSSRCPRAGDFPFQEWFVARGHRDDVDGVRFEGEATPAPGVLEALAEADAIVIAPSNPYVSIWPILAVPAIREALAARRVPAVAVSPLVGGRAVKGPADRMLARMAGGTTPAHVAGCYEGLIDALVLDESDPAGPLAVRAVATRTLMTDLDASRRLAETVLEAAA
jgi:hypothetical protein